MIRRALILFAAALALSLPSVAAIRLYLKDGTHHKVSEYEKKADRVRYYSTERSEWEEIPLELVDLSRTEKEQAQQEAERKEQAKIMDAEEKAERTLASEVASIPYEAGVFQVKNGKAEVLKLAESKAVNNKRRSILKAITPIPILSGKATVEIDGTEALYRVAPGQPEFYIRLATDERFTIVKLEPEKNARIVQHWDIVPVTKEVIETTATVPTFRQQLAEGLYKIWPEQPLTPGEYAVVEYTEGKGNIQVWDFSVR